MDFFDVIRTRRSVRRYLPDPVGRELLGAPDHLRVWSLMPVGRPDGRPSRPAKSAPADVTHYNGFGRGAD